MDFLKLTKDKLNLEDITDLVNHESCGATSVFIGTTRDNFENKSVVSLEYEVYESMALKSLKNICNNLRSEYSDIHNIAIYHRLGLVPVKEASVIIAISSPHRQTSLECVKIAIDELKKSVPIWKKEIYVDNLTAWKENNESKPIPKKFIKRPKIDFNLCNIESIQIPNNLIQIGAEENEVTRRIQSFVEKKREDIDQNNIHDFIENKTNDENSCARTNSVLIKQNGCKGHLKVQRVKNEFGPQIKTNYSNTLDKLMENNLLQTNIKQEFKFNENLIPSGIAERICNVEKFLNISTPISKDIYERIKIIEDKLSYLETISPEYLHFVDKKPLVTKKTPVKKTYSIQDLDDYIEMITNKINNNGA